MQLFPDDHVDCIEIVLIPPPIDSMLYCCKAHCLRNRKANIGWRKGGSFFVRDSKNCITCTKIPFEMNVSQHFCPSL